MQPYNLNNYCPVVNIYFESKVLKQVAVSGGLGEDSLCQ